MAVTIRLFSYLREAAGSSVIKLADLDLPCRLVDVLEHVTKNHPKLRLALLTDRGLLNDELHVLINGQGIDGTSENVLFQSVRDGDEIVIIPPVGGG